MFILTGGAGFIGSAFLSKLNREGVSDVLVVDHLGSSDKWHNLLGKSFTDYLPREDFLPQLLAGRLSPQIEAVIHLGACSSTTETNVDFLLSNNYRYSKDLADHCARRNIRFVYASSAATYGAGELGYSDKSDISGLRPLNPYGYSKQIFDIYMERSRFAASAAGIKFFNVFGPNEYHKGAMSSLVGKAVRQVQETGKIRLFKSNSPSYGDGDQMRDFVYVKDCCETMWWLLNRRDVTGLFNLGTGKARSWNDLAQAVFSALGKQPSIEYFEMPESLRCQYQNFTEADMAKVRAAGAPVPSTSLEDAVRDYVQNYLVKPWPYL